MSKDFETLLKAIDEDIEQQANQMVIDTTHGHKLFYAFVKEACELHAVKNQDYGGGNPLGNFLECEKQELSPVRGILVRMSDKYSRINSLVKKGGEGEVRDESLLDTFLDLANYSLLAAVMFKLYGLDLSTTDERIEFSELGCTPPGTKVEVKESYPMTNYLPFQRTCSTCQHYHISFEDMPCRKCIDKDGILPHWRSR